MFFTNTKKIAAITFLAAAVSTVSSNALALECHVEFFGAGQNDAGSWGVSDNPYSDGVIRQYPSGLVAYQFGDVWVTTASEAEMFGPLDEAIRGLAASASLSDAQRTALSEGGALIRGHIHVSDPNKRLLTDAVFPVGDDVIVVSAIPNPDDSNGYFFAVQIPSGSCQQGLM